MQKGIEQLDEDMDFYKVSQERLGVPWIGSDKSRLDMGDNVMWDINGDSTNLPVFCKMMIVHQGACLVNSPAVLTRDAGVQVCLRKFFKTRIEKWKDAGKYLYYRKLKSVLYLEFFRTLHFSHTFETIIPEIFLGISSYNAGINEFFGHSKIC